MAPGWINDPAYKGIFTPVTACAGSNSDPCPTAFPAPGATNTFTGYQPYASFGSLQYGVKQPYVMQWNLSIDQQLPGGIGLSVSYVGTRGNHLWTEADANPCQPTNAPGSQTISGSVIPNTAINWVNAVNAACPAGYDNATYHNNGTLGANQPCPSYSFDKITGAVVVTPYGFSSGPAGNSNDGRFNCSFGSEIQIGTSAKSIL